MNKRVAAIVEEARKLTPEERWELVDRLLAESEASEGTPAEIDAAWIEECERRVAAHERGETGPGITHGEMMQRLRETIRRA